MNCRSWQSYGDLCQVVEILHKSCQQYRSPMYIQCIIFIHVLGVYAKLFLLLLCLVIVTTIYHPFFDKST